MFERSAREIPIERERRVGDAKIDAKGDLLCLLRLTRIEDIASYEKITSRLRGNMLDVPLHPDTLLLEIIFNELRRRLAICCA